ERPADIEMLSRFMLHKACAENGMPAKTITPSAMNVLLAYHWPGNVRELQNLMERAALACPTSELDAESLGRLWSRKPGPVVVQDRMRPVVSESRVTHSHVDDWKSLEDIEAEHIARTLERVELNKSAAARLLKIDRKRLDRKIEKYNLLRFAAG